MGSAAVTLPTLAPLARTWRRRVFVSTWICYVGYYFARKPFSIVKAQLGKELSFSATDLGTIYATYLIAYTAGQFASGALGPRLGPRKMLLGGMALSVLCALGFAGGTGLTWFILLMAANGLGQATGWSNSVGTMASWYRRQERGTVMGIWATNFQVGGVASNALAAYTLVHLGYRASFWSGALVLVGAALIVFLWQRNRPEDVGLPAIVVDPTSEVPADVASEGPPKWSRSVWITVLLIGGAYFGMKFIRYALWSWAPYFLTNHFGLAGDDAGYVSTLFDVCGIAGVIVTGWLSDRFFRGRRALVSFWMVCGLVAASAVLVTWGTGSVVAFALSIGLVGFTLYGPDSLLTGAGAMDVGGGRGAVRASGIISGLGSAGSVLQELVIARLYDAKPNDIAPIFATLLASALFAAICVGAIVWRNRQGSSDL